MFYFLLIVSLAGLGVGYFFFRKHNQKKAAKIEAAARAKFPSSFKF